MNDYELEIQLTMNNLRFTETHAVLEYETVVNLAFC